MRLILTTMAFGLFATAVQAGGPPITMQVGEDVPTTRFQIVGPADFQDLKINATANTDYFIGMASLSGERAQIFDPNGQPLAAFNSSEGSQGPEDWGAELHALAAGAYTVRVAPMAEADPTSFPVDVETWAWPDCRGGPATKCTVASGKTKSSTFGAGNDDDSFVIKAPAGRRYAATLTLTGGLYGGQYVSCLSVLAKSGKELVRGCTGLGPSSRFTRTVKFTLPGSGGPYYLKAEATSASHRGRGTYDLTLKPL